MTELVPTTPLLPEYFSHYKDFHLTLEKFGKNRAPINDEALQVIKHYRQYLEKLPYPTSEEHTPILTLRKQEKRIGTRQVNRLMHVITYLAAEKFAAYPEKSARIKRIAVHGCRHIFATLQEQAEISLIQIRDNMRHSDLQTTSIYLHSSDIKRHAKLQNVKLSSLKDKIA